MTDRTEAQTLGVDAISDKQNVANGIDPDYDAAARQAVIDRTPMKDEVIAKSDLMDILNTHCQMGNTAKVNGAIPISITGTGSEDLYPPDNPQPTTGGDYNGFVKVTGLQKISEKGGLSVANSEITVAIAGDYYTTHAYLDLSTDINGNSVGFIFAVERSGNYTFGERTIGSKIFNSGTNRNNIAGGGFLPELLVGDKVSVWVASEKTTTLNIFDANVGLNLRAPASLVT